MSESTLAATGNAFRLAARLVVPVSCAGCGHLDLPLCRACRELLTTKQLLRCDSHAPRLDPVTSRALFPVWALWANTDQVKDAITRWKDHGRLDLSRHFLKQAQHAGRLLQGASELPADLVVVAVPSTGKANRARFGQLTAALAAAVTAGINHNGTRASVRSVLRLRAKGRDQSGLGARERQLNLASRVQLRTRLAPHTRILLVDDVQTTGASLAACREVLLRHRANVVGALVLAFTPDPRRGTIDLTKT